MINREVITVRSKLNKIHQEFKNKHDKDYLLHRYYKVGEGVNSKEMLFKSLTMLALCSGYCEVDIVAKSTLDSNIPLVEANKEKEESTYWGEQVRYRECILERTFNCETNKEKKYVDWVLGQYPQFM